MATVVSFNAALGALESVCLWQKTLHLLSVLHEERLQESVVTYLTAISACGKGERWQSASHLLYEAVQNRGQVVEVYNAAITAFDRCQQWERALALFGQVKDMNLMDVVSVNAALSACSSCSTLVPDQMVLSMFMTFYDPIR